VQDGIINGEPLDVAQTPDGYVWIGTANGLLRFDGVRFVLWASGSGEVFSKAVYSLLAAPDGTLWIGTGSGLAVLRDGALKTYPTSSGRVNAIVQDRQGVIWFARSRVRDQNGPLCSVVADSVKCYGKPDGIPVPFAGMMSEDPSGNLWIGTATSVIRWKAGSVTSFELTTPKSNAGLEGVSAFAPAVDGSMWVGIARQGHQLGLQRLVKDKWTPFRTAEFDGESLSVAALYRDKHDALWVGTRSQGLYRIHGNDVDHLTAADGLSGNSINAISEDSEGNIWVTTSRGVDSLRDLKVLSLSAREGLTAGGPGPLLAARDGSVWIGNDDALDQLRDGKVRSLHGKDGLPGQRVTALFEDREGQFWVGTDRGLFTYAGGRFTPIRRSGGSPLGLVMSVIQDSDGSVWAECIADRKLVKIDRNRVTREFSDQEIPGAIMLAAAPDGGIWLGPRNGGLARYRQGRLEAFQTKDAGIAQQIVANPDGTVIAATTLGVLGFRDGKLQALTQKNGLPCDSLYAIAFDVHENLWVYAQCGLVKIAAAELEDWWAHPDAKVHGTVLDAFDGAQPAHFWFPPGAVRSVDGRLWFANESVVQVVDPEHMAWNSTPPPVRIEQIVANHKRLLPGASLQLPPVVRDLELDYTALSFVNPAKVRFRYMLEGHDLQWQDPGTRREAFYTDLRPGNYRFRVMASNNDGVWNEAGASLSFIVAPAWYQMKSFYVVCFVAAALLILLVHRLRMRYAMNSLSTRFDERLAERTRIAREFHDTLLQTIEGSKLVADDALDQSGDPVRMRRAVEQLSEWLARAIQEGRAALQSLRTSATETNDLAEGLRRATEECRMFSPMKTSLSVQGETKEMHPVVRDEAYRIAYEAIRNACVHSKASELSVELKYAQNLSIRVSDNGVGIPSELLNQGKNGHYGLRGMRERAERIGGKLKIVSSANSGTEVAVEIPGRVVFLRPDESAMEKIASVFRAMK
jgi:signal transduction histidine kinase/ligand-binding sensor domain-containing protein